MRKPKKIKLFEEFSQSSDEGVIKVIKLVDNEGNVLDKPGKSEEELGMIDEEGCREYMGGIAEDGTIIGVNGGYIQEGTPLAQQYPHLVANCSMNDKEELFDMIPGDKYKGQKQFKKIGKFTQ